MTYVTEFKCLQFTGATEYRFVGLVVGLVTRLVKSIDVLLEVKVENCGKWAIGYFYFRKKIEIYFGGLRTAYSVVYKIVKKRDTDL